MFMTAWVFEVLLRPTLLNEIKKTKLQIYTSPQAGINILLATVVSPIVPLTSPLVYFEDLSELALAVQ